MPDIKLFQDGRVEDTKLANAGFLAAKTEVYRGGMAVEESLLVEFLDPVAVGLLGVVAVNEGSAEHGQDTVEKAVDDFETAVLAAEGGGEVALVAGLALSGLVLEDDVGDLEDPHGDAVALVLADGLEETRQQRGADDLVL